MICGDTPLMGRCMHVLIIITHNPKYLDQVTHCHLICCVYIKGLINIVNTKDQSSACMCEMMSKGLKEALIVLIVTYVKRVKMVFLAYVHNIDTFNAMSKGPKDYVMLKQGTYTFLLITFCMQNYSE